MRVYILYDARAMDDTDDATVLVCLGQMKNSGVALEEAEKDWTGYEWALFLYREGPPIDGRPELVDEQFEYYHAPGQKPYHKGL